MAKLLSGIEINVDSNSIRKRSTSFSKASLESALVTLNNLFTPYHERMEINNDFPNENLRDLVNSSQLLYKNSDKEGNSVRKATNNSLLEICNMFKIRL